MTGAGSMSPKLTDTKHDEAQPNRTRLDSLEQGAKIFATAMVPIIVAVGGWFIQKTIENDKERAAQIQRDQQNALDKDKISLEYVKIAKEILTSAEKQIPAELTKWSWKVLDGVSPIKFEKEDLSRLIERKERIPIPATSRGFGEYEWMFKTMVMTTGEERLDAINDKISANKAQYGTIEKALGIPWFVVGVLHYLESGLRFDRHLHNNDPLSGRTVNVPAGRPLTGQPPFSWEESAIDALQMLGWAGEQDWSLTRTLYRIEQYNGFGYRRFQTNSPYLWNCTSHYIKGYYVSDGQFDPEAVAPTCGAAGLLKRMMDRKLIALK
jgi:lysozyme family protein